MLLAPTNPSIYLPQKVVKSIKSHHCGTSNFKTTTIMARLTIPPTKRVKKKSASWNKRSLGS